MATPTRARAAGILSFCLLLVSALGPTGALAGAAPPLTARPAAAAITIGANSCIGIDACLEASGPIGDNSCIGQNSCRGAGTVGHNSCTGYGACAFANAVGNNSCNGETACFDTQGSVGSNSCNDGSACADTFYVGNNSCNTTTDDCQQVFKVGDCWHNDVRPAACPEPGPDFRIRQLGGLLWGRNVYNLDAAGQQIYARNTPGTTRQIVLTVQNDGAAPDAFTIRRSKSRSAGHLAVTYYRGWPGHEITRQVYRGTLITPTLAPGAIFTYRVYIRVPAGALEGDFVKQRLLVQSGSDPTKKDTVQFRVTVI